MATVLPERAPIGGSVEGSFAPSDARIVSSHSGIRIELSPRFLALTFASVVGLLFVAHVTVQTLRFTLFDSGSMGGLVPLFSLGADGNLPNFYSSLALLFSGLLLVATGVATRLNGERDGWHWLGLAAVFGFLSLDEMMELHERLIEPVREALGTGGLLFYAWIIPYSLAAAALLIIYSPFLLRLPRATATLMVIAGAMFVAGAVGLEMLGGLHFERYGSQNPGYVALQTIEETLEMMGIVVFIYAISSFLVRRYGPFSVRLGQST